MGWTGSAPNQVYVRTDGTRTGAAVNVTAKGLGINDTAVLADARENDFAAALNLVLKRDGGNSASADLPMNSHKLTGLSLGLARTDSIRLDQVQDGDLVYAEASGTADAIVLTTTPTCSPVEGMVIGFVAEADSTDAVTVDLNGDGALALQVAGAALVGGEVQNGQFHQIGFDGVQWQLLNPYVDAAAAQPLNAGLTDIAGLAVTVGNIIVGDGDNWVAESGLTARASLGLEIGADVQAYDAATLFSDTTATLTAGYTVTPEAAGTKTTGTFTPDPAEGNIQTAVNGGAHTLAPPSSDCTMIIQYTNNASAGTITTSGFTLVDGDAITTTNGHDFFFQIVKIGSFSSLTVKALQ